ncbi:MAG: cytochrome c peroxidase [Pirellula sp.]|jgi:YVTN family beta-propeller protein
MNTQTTSANLHSFFDQLARIHWIAMLVGLFFGSTYAFSSDAEDNAACYRKPVAILHLPRTDQLVLATKNDGSLLFYNRLTHQLEQKLSLGGSLESVVPILDGKYLAAIDSVQHLVHIVESPTESQRSNAKLHKSLVTSRYPQRALWDYANSMLYVSCVWSKRLDVFSLAIETESLVADKKAATIDLPVWPGAMMMIKDELLVTDNFGADACRVSTLTHQVTKRKDWFGSSVRSLVEIPTKENEPKKIGVMHTVLNEYARTNPQEIQWGVLLTNDLRLLNVDRVLDDEETNVYRSGRFHPVGIPGNGAAEPTDISVHHETGRVAVAVGGTDQVAIGDIDSVAFRFLDVGRFPTAVAWSPDGNELYVANQFDDTYSVVDVLNRKVVRHVSLGTMRSLEPKELGEQLFHSATLSHDRWLTCASCHIDGHTNHQLSDNLGDLDFGAPKRTPSLRGIRDTAPYTWLGHSQTLEAQTVASIRKTMNSYRRLDKDEVEHLVAFMESLEPLPSVAEARGIVDHEQVREGKLVFERVGCAECHSEDRYTSFGVYDVGIKDENEKRLFNPPSLKGLSQRGPMLFHDNRAHGIRGVLVDEKHQLTEELSDRDLENLIQFLESL